MRLRRQTNRRTEIIKKDTEWAEVDVDGKRIVVRDDLDSDALISIQDCETDEKYVLTVDELFRLLQRLEKEKIVNLRIFKNLAQNQSFYLDTRFGRVSFTKIANEAKVINSGHYLFEAGSYHKFNDNTSVVPFDKLE